MNCTKMHRSKNIKLLVMSRMRPVAIEIRRNPEQWTKMVDTEEIAVCHVTHIVQLDIRNIHFGKVWHLTIILTDMYRYTIYCFHFLMLILNFGRKICLNCK